jgi:hypothetical protein
VSLATFGHLLLLLLLLVLLLLLLLLLLPRLVLSLTFSQHLLQEPVHRGSAPPD